MRRSLRTIPLVLFPIVAASWLVRAAQHGADHTQQMLTLDIGDLAPGDSVVITFEVDVDRELPFEEGVYSLSSHGQVTGANFSAVLTDDPDTPELADPTVTLVRDSMTPILTSDLSVVPNEGDITVSWRLSEDGMARLAGVGVQRALVAQDRSGIAQRLPCTRKTRCGSSTPMCNMDSQCDRLT